MLVFKGAGTTLILVFSGINLHGQKIRLIRRLLSLHVHHMLFAHLLLAASKLSPNETF